MPVLPSASRRSVSDALLARGERHLLSPEDRRLLRGQRVLIAGAAGALGAALARRLARCRPSALALFDLADSGLVRLELDLLERHPVLPVTVIVGDVTRASDVRHAVRSVRPDVVFHLASASEVSAAERAACAAVRTNVFGALHVARETSLAGARLVLASAREAGTAATVLGATRRLAELVTLCPSHDGYRPVIVRLDDIVDASGGAVPQMVARLRSGRPLLIANEETRLPLMTMAEAVSLLLKADLVGRRGEVYRLDTGLPVRLADLAERLLAWGAQAGLRRVPVRVASQGRGAAAAGGGGGFGPARHPALGVRHEPVPDTAALSRILRALRHDLRRRDALAVLANLRAAVPGYEPSRMACEVAAASTLHATWPAASRPSPSVFA